VAGLCVARLTLLSNTFCSDISGEQDWLGARNSRTKATTGIIGTTNDAFQSSSDLPSQRNAMKIKLYGLLIVGLAPLTLHAQDRMAPLGPQIAVTGRGDVKVSPDRATIQISVQTRASTAAAAATENASKTQAVLAALRALGLGNDQLSTINYNVNPEQRYEPNKEPVVVGYTVTNTVLAEVRRLDQVGPVIDAALSRGANMITSLQFFASNTEAARRAAITVAIEKARADAEAAAKAARGTLGTFARDQYRCLCASPSTDDDDEANGRRPSKHTY
jgi:uncharacterized protein YggE